MNNPPPPPERELPQPMIQLIAEILARHTKESTNKGKAA